MKLKNLEGLRGLAALSVVFFHFFAIYYPTLTNATLYQARIRNGIEMTIATTPLNILYNGNFAVCIFFVLSGFALSYKFFKTGDSQAITDSALRRYFRLMIPVLFSVICFYLLFSFKFSWVENNIQNFSLLNALREGTYKTFFSLHNHSYNPVLWTMHFEFFGSFLVFGFCLIFGKTKNRVWCYILALLVFWNSNYVAFILGVMISDLTNNHKLQLDSKWIKFILLCLAVYLGSYPNHIETVDGSVPMSSTIYALVKYFDNTGLMAQTIGAALMLFVILRSVKITKFLSTRPLQFFGDISFSLYLIHTLVITFFSSFLFNFFLNSANMPFRYSFILMLLISLVLILTLSYLMYLYIDRLSIAFSTKSKKILFDIEKVKLNT